MQPPGEPVAENSSNCNNGTGNFNTRRRIPLLGEQEIHFHRQTIRIWRASRRWNGLDADQEGFSEVPTWAPASIQLSSHLSTTHTLQQHFMHLQPFGTWVTRLCQRYWESRCPYFTFICLGSACNHSHFSPDYTFYPQIHRNAVAVLVNIIIILPWEILTLRTTL